MQGQVVYEGKVLPEWIDYNGHMNVAWYVLAFDYGVDALWEQFGITQEYVARANGSTFAVEAHINYLREIRLDDPFTVTSQILAYDDKRIHQYMRMYHLENNYLAATMEWMNLFVDLNTRRVSSWPAEILDKIAAFAAGQSDMTMPENRGHRISVKAPLWETAGY